MLTWLPDPATRPWAEVQEDEIWAEPRISATDDVLTVTGYSYAVIGGPIVGLAVSTSAMGVVVSAPASLLGSFPITDIEYQIAGVTGHCASFSALPSNADEVIRYIPNPAGSKEWTLRVTATLSDGTNGSADFILKVYANFTPGANALKGAVDARRH